MPTTPTTVTQYRIEHADLLHKGSTTDSKGRLWLGSQVDGIIVDGKQIGHGHIDCMMMDNRKRQPRKSRKKASV